MPSQQFPQSEKFNCVFQLIKHQHNKAFIFSSIPVIPHFLSLPHVFLALSGCPRSACFSQVVKVEMGSSVLTLSSIRLIVLLFGFCVLVVKALCQSLKGLLMEAKGEFNGCLFRGLCLALPSLSELHETMWNLLWPQKHQLSIFVQVVTVLRSQAHTHILTQTQVGALNML